MGMVAHEQLAPEEEFLQRNESLIVGNGTLVVAIAIWQALWSAGKISPLIMTGPSVIARRCYEDLRRGHLLRDLAYSGRNFAIGFVFALVAGVGLGI
jgi:ABC-type nitrate/sulfonate/bicarbonate transport system permease component